MPAWCDAALSHSSHSENRFFPYRLVLLPSMTIPPSSPGAIRGAVSPSNAAVSTSFHSSSVSQQSVPLIGHCFWTAHACRMGHWAALADNDLRSSQTGQIMSFAPKESAGLQQSSNDHHTHNFFLRLIFQICFFQCSREH